MQFQHHFVQQQSDPFKKPIQKCVAISCAFVVISGAIQSGDGLGAEWREKLPACSKETLPP